MTPFHIWVIWVKKHVFFKKRWILPICKFNVKFKFQKWITCRMDFGNFEEKKFCFPNGKSTWKFDHPYILEKWIFFQRLLFIFDVFHPYLTLKSVSKSNFVLHMGDLIQKNDFFYHDFFNFTNMYLLFRPKNTSKWSHLLWKRCQKNLQKNEKIMKFWSWFYYMWHNFETKKPTFFRNIYIWVIWWKIHRNSRKNEKIWDFLTSFYNIWYYFNTKIQRFYQISTYG